MNNNHRPKVKIKFRQKKHLPHLSQSINCKFYDLKIPRIQDIKEKEEKLSDTTTETENELTEQQSNLIDKWIDNNLSKINTINKRNTIYEIIDAFNITENPDFNVTTEQFCASMLKAGFKVQDERFNVSGVSIKKLRHITEKMQRCNNCR